MLSFLRRLFGHGPRPDPYALLDQAAPSQVRVVVGLGNPGPKYAATRHNVGFLAVEQLARAISATWVDDQRQTRSVVAYGCPEDVPLLLARPQTFMNASGEAVDLLLRRLDLAPSQVLVIYDDMDLSPGSLRLRERGSAGTHNGMRSIVQALGTDRVPRLRIGIGQAGPRDTRDYVLSPWTSEEQPIFEAAIRRAAEAALVWATKGAPVAMNRYNS